MRKKFLAATIAAALLSATVGISPASAGTTSWSTIIYSPSVTRTSPTFYASAPSASMSLVISGPNNMCKETEVRLVRILASGAKQYFAWQTVERCHTSFTDTDPWQEMARYSTTPQYDDVYHSPAFPAGNYQWQARGASSSPAQASMNATMYYSG
jgi:hypothetical protein